MALHFNRRAFLAGAALLSAARPSLAEIGRAFDIETGDGTPIRNFRIAQEMAPSDLPGLILAGPTSADLVLYEFFDYACPFCRTASQDIDILLTPEIRDQGRAGAVSGAFDAFSRYGAGGAGGGPPAWRRSSLSVSRRAVRASRPGKQGKGARTGGAPGAGHRTAGGPGGQRGDSRGPRSPDASCARSHAQVYAVVRARRFRLRGLAGRRILSTNSNALCTAAAAFAASSPVDGARTVARARDHYEIAATAATGNRSAAIKARVFEGFEKVDLFQIEAHGG